MAENNESKEVEKEADNVKQGVKAAGTAVAQFWTGNWGGAAITVIRNFKSIFAVVALLIFLPLIIITAIVSSLFAGVSNDNFFSSPETYQESFGKMYDTANSLVNDAYEDYYPTAVEKGAALQAGYDKDPETIESDDGHLIQEYTYVNNVGINVIPGKGKMRVNRKKMTEMIARYSYIQNYVLEHRLDDGFYDEYMDPVVNIDDPQGLLKHFQSAFVQSIISSNGSRKYFSSTASPSVYTAEEVTNEWVEEQIIGYYEAGEWYTFPAGSQYIIGSTGDIHTYTKETYTIIKTGRTYVVDGTTYDGYLDGDSKLPKTDSITHQEITITYTGSIRVTVSQNTDMFMKYDYRDTKGYLHRGYDTIIKELGGNPNAIYRSTVMSETQRDIVDSAYDTPTAGDSLCAGWVSSVYGRLGVYIGGDAIDMWSNDTQYDYFGNETELKPGMLIAVDHANADTSSDGYIYGHVSIYVGDNIIRTNYTTGTGGTVRDFTVEEWLAHYGAYQGGTVRMGYPSALVDTIASEPEDVFSGNGYLQAAINIAEDPSVGYSTENNLMDPNVDCGSFVTFALRAIGISMNLYEPNDGMEERLVAAGFTYHEGMDGVQCGDILYVYGHTEIYIGEMEGRIGLWQVGAHGSRSNIYDEVSITEYFGDGYWSGYYRADDLGIVGVASLNAAVSQDPVVKKANEWISDMAEYIQLEFIGTATADYSGKGYTVDEVEDYYETLSVTDEDIAEAAKALGLSEENAIRCERLVMREISSLDPYLQYLMACTAVNHGLDSPNRLYVSWGGSDGSYTEEYMSNSRYDPDDDAKLAVYLALTNLNEDAWDCHGFTLENALWCTGDVDMATYTGDVQDSGEAIYLSYVYDWYYNYGVWPRDAGWYPQPTLTPNWEVDK